MLVTRNVTLAEKIFNLNFDSNGTVEVRIQTGWLNEFGDFQEIPGSTRLYLIDAITASGVLDVIPTEGLTRREDIAKNVYNYLLEQGLIIGGITP